MTPAEKLLRDAADYIRKHGWTRVLMRDDDGRVCMLGACSEVCSSSSYKAVIAVIDALEDVCGVPASIFNDHHCETADDAIAALEIAADLCAE